MPPIKQYLRVKRISFRDWFLLSRVDAVDGQRFRPGDVVAACGACRQVSKRAHWLKADNACPCCGSKASLPFDGKRDLISGAEPPVVYSARDFHFKSFRRVPVKALLLAAATVLLLILLWPRSSHSQAGFIQTEDGHFAYQDLQGQRYTTGDYSIDGQVYHFEDGLLKGEYAIKIGNTTKITDENGALRKGWAVYEQNFVYLDEYGVVNSRVPSTVGDGFFDLEGLGTVFVTARHTPGNGWRMYQQRLYHFQDGKPAPVPNLPGRFTEQGAYLPDQAGFVETEYGDYYVDQAGHALTGYVAHQGFVYHLEEETGLLSVLRDNEIPGLSMGFAGALIPEEDTLLPCQGGSVIIQARTGAIRTGWVLLDGSIYCANAEGYLRCGEESASPRGVFDAKGRFLPAQAGRLQADGLTCYVNQDGSLAVGCVKEGEYLALYSASGALRANEDIAGIGITDANGVLRPYAAGMYTIEGYTYCLNQQGQVLTGWQRIGKLYYFDPATGRRASAGALVDGVAYPLSRDGSFTPAAEGLYQLGQDSYYVLTDGSVASGWRAVEDQLRYFDEQSGKLRQEGAENAQTGWVQKNAARFYVLQNGQVARGWQIIQGRAYYFSQQTGAAVTGTQQIDGGVYHFREDGALLPDHPLALTVDGVSIRIGESGAPEGGFLCSNGHLYYYDQATAALSIQLPENVAGWTSALGGYLIPQAEGPLQAGRAAYYLDSAGNVISGWFIRGDLLYYADPGTGILAPNGRSAAWAGTFRDGVFTPDHDGLFQADGRDYLFTGGKLANGWVLLADGSGIGYMEAGQGYVTDTVRIVKDQVCQFSESGRYIPRENRLMRVQNKTYFLLADGSLPSQQGVYPLSMDQAAAWEAEQNSAAFRQPSQRSSAYEAGGYLIAVLSGGQTASSAREAGLPSTLTVGEGGRVVPLSPGIQEIGDNAYLLQADGSFAVNVCLYQRHLYHFDPHTGVMTRGLRGFGENGVFSPAAPGIYMMEDVLYWFTDTFGTVGIGWMEDEEGQVRYADQDGHLAIGLTQIDGNRYFFLDPNQGCVMARNQFITAAASGTRFEYYAGADGRLAVGWQEVFGVLHYFDADGHMLYDTVQDGRYINIYGEVI